MAESDDTAAAMQTPESSSELNGDPQLNGQSLTDPADSTEKTNEASDVEKYWVTVRSNPQDFTSWTYLLQLIEQQSDLEKAREAFDEFFKIYPYCYGYWKKYADMEKRFENIEAAQKVYERGLVAIPLSVDLWIHYITYYRSLCEGQDSAEIRQNIRGLFERAITSAGKEFRSDKLWESYIAWEYELKELKCVLQIYDKLLNVPTLQYSNHFEKFKEFISSVDSKEVTSEEEYSEFAKLAKNVVNEEDGDDDEEAREKTDEEKIKKEIIKIRHKVHRKNETEVGKRWKYEEGIKRPYFHVKPLEKTQLQNWKDYLDYEISKGDRERIILLFERCLIACAMYEEIWMKYASYLKNSEEEARSIYKRACIVHLPKKPAVHLAWSAFEESLENHTAALNILVNLEQTLPGLLEVTVRRINLERRRGNHQAVQQLYQHCVDNAPTGKLKSHFSLKFARYYFKVMNKPMKAIELIRTAMDKDKGNIQLYMQLIDLGYHSCPPDEDLILDTFRKAISCSDVSDHDKFLMSQRRMEYLEDFGSEIKSLLKVYDEHKNIVEKHSSNKRSLEESMTSDEKKMKLDGDSYAASGDSTQYNYGNQAAWQNYQNAYGYQWNQYQGYYSTS